MPEQQTRDALHFPPRSREALEPFLPPTAAPPADQNATTRPFVTLTFATSLDSSLALQPGVPTALSGPQSKAMTHFLRSRHDAILVGVGTALADDPSLNCRLEGVGGYGGQELVGQPRPVILDPAARWDVASAKVTSLAGRGKGRAPFVITSVEPPQQAKRRLESTGGKYIVLGRGQGAPGLPAARPSEPIQRALPWQGILDALASEGQRSVMVEGGGTVINGLLHPSNLGLVDAVMVTIAPTWLGRGGVVVSPDPRTEHGARVPTARLRDVEWCPLGEDVVLCGRPRR